MPSPRVTLYTRDGCCLCQEAKTILANHGLSPEVVDIDEDPELAARFTCTVPVVAIDGKIRFRGRVEERLLRRLLTARKDAPGSQ